MQQLILFLAKYRSTLLLIVFVLIALLRHSLKNPVAEHRLNNVGFGAVIMACLAGSSIGDSRQSMRNWPARMRDFAPEEQGLLQIIFQILQTTISYQHVLLTIRTLKGTITLSFMPVAEMVFSREWGQ